MTREEAIEILEEVRTIDDSMYQYNERYLQALDLAIKALKQTEDKEVITNQEWLSYISPEDWVRVIHWLYHDYGTRFTDSEGAILKWLRQDVREEQTFEVLQPCTDLQPCTESLPPFWFRKEQE